MTSALQEWEDHYRPLLGRRLETFCFMPLTGSDTPGVVESLHGSPIWFSGAVEVAFEDAPPVFLTWETTTDSWYRLEPLGSLEDRWRPYSLDSIQRSFEGAWDGLVGAVLQDVRLHALQGPVPEAVAAVEHRLVTDDGPRAFWVSTAYGKTVDNGDDLCVWMDTPPPGEVRLIAMGTIQ